MSEESGANRPFDPELDGRDGVRQSDPETERLTQGAINNFMRQAVGMIKKGAYGRLELGLEFKNGQVVEAAITEKKTEIRQTLSKEALDEKP